MSPPISRVLSWTIIFLGRLLPNASRDLPENTTSSRMVFYSVLLRVGFTGTLPVTRQAVSSYLAFAPLPPIWAAVYFCCTFLGVASTGRYPAPCSMELGLSSQTAFRPDGGWAAPVCAIARRTHSAIDYTTDAPFLSTITKRPRR